MHFISLFAFSITILQLRRVDIPLFCWLQLNNGSRIVVVLGKLNQIFPFEIMVRKIIHGVLLFENLFPKLVSTFLFRLEIFSVSLFLPCIDNIYIPSMTVCCRWAKSLYSLTSCSRSSIIYTEPLPYNFLSLMV